MSLKKTKKSDETKRVTGKFEKIGGSVVMLPPDDVEPEEEVTQESPLVIEEKDSMVILQPKEGEEEVQQVTDEASEIESRKLASKVRKENKERADKASVKNNPAKVGDSVVSDSNLDCFRDIT